MEVPWWRFLEATLRTWPRADAETFDSVATACPVAWRCQLQCCRQGVRLWFLLSAAPGLQCSPLKLVQTSSFCPYPLSVLVHEFIYMCTILFQALKALTGLRIAVLYIQLGTEILSKEKFCISAILSGDHLQTRWFLEPNRTKRKKRKTWRVSLLSALETNCLCFLPCGLLGFYLFLKCNHWKSINYPSICISLFI